MTSGRSSVEACKECSSVLSTFMTMSEMQTSLPSSQPMDTSFSQTSFSQSQDFSLQQSRTVVRPPGKVLQPGPTETPIDAGKRMAVSEIAKVSSVYNLLTVIADLMYISV